MKTSNQWLVLCAVIVAYIPVILDMTILHVAVPSLTLALSATSNEVLWIIDIYPLVMAGLLVPMGTLADRIGYKLMLLVGLTVFGIASAVAAFSTSPGTLIGARAGLGVGASMIMPCVLAVIRQVFTEDRDRAEALGVWSIVGAAGAAVGPLAGGLLLEHFWWGSVFLINVPVMLIVIPVAWALIPSLPGNPAARWKIADTAILIAGLIATVYGIKSGFKVGFSITPVVTMIAGIAFLIWFARLQLRSDTPMLDMSLLTKPVIAAGLLMAFVAAGALAGFELVLAQELQFVLGMTPLEAGMFMLPLVISAAVGGPLGGWLSSRFGLRSVATTSMALAALALYGIAAADFAHDTVMVTGLLMTLGLSLGIGLLASSVAIMGSAPPEKAGAAGALESTGYELGGGLGVTFFGVFVNSIYRSSLDTDMDEARNSIGEAMTLAQSLGGERGEVVASAAKAAFVSAHGTVLFVSATLIAILAVAVFIALRRAVVAGH